MRGSKWNALQMQFMSKPKDHNGKDAGIAEDDFIITPRSRISFKGSSHVGGESMAEIRNLLEKLDRLVFGDFFTVRADALANTLRKLATVPDTTINLHDQ